MEEYNICEKLIFETILFTNKQHMLYRLLTLWLMSLHNPTIVMQCSVIGIPHALGHKSDVLDMPFNCRHILVFRETYQDYQKS